MKNCNFLVSIAVITYNSSKYIIETLESIKAQSYQDLELIISDDCSTDNTVELCQEWIEKNKGRFVRTNIIVPKENTGIPANVNRAIQASRGIWIKPIAGDDLFLPDAIEKYINYVKVNNDVQLVFAKICTFRINENGVIDEQFIETPRDDIDCFNKQTAREQYLDYLNYESKGGGSPTYFFKRELLVKYPFNENYPGYDDGPELIKLTRNGVHLNFMDEFTVKYRIGESLSHSTKRFFSSILWQSKHLYFWNELRYYLIEEGLYDSYNQQRKLLLLNDLQDCLLKNKVTFFHKIVNKFLCYALFKYNLISF